MKTSRRSKEFKNNCKDYALNSGLHGCRYFGEPGLHPAERVIWAISVALGIVLCAILIGELYEKWDQTPVIVSFNDRLVHVSEVPFPAVTICPQNKVKVSEYNFTQNLATHFNGTSHYDEMEMFEDICQICGKSAYCRSYLNRTAANQEAVKNLIKVAPNLTDTIWHCSWNGKDCSAQFATVLTQEGVCFTFNLMSAAEMFDRFSLQASYNYSTAEKYNSGWDINRGFNATYNRSDLYPKQGREYGADADLIIFLGEQTTERDTSCNVLESGYKLFLHHPADLPRTTNAHYALPPKHLTRLALEFTAISASEKLSKYPAKKRQCYFSHERKLRYFNTYTKSNCELECLSNYTFRQCGCVQYYMPHNDSEQICNYVEKDICMDKAKDDLADIGMHMKELSNEGAMEEACKCMPSCNYVGYSAQVSQSPMDFWADEGAFLRSFLNEKEINEITKLEEEREVAGLRIFFKESDFMSMRRSELFGRTDFIANCGGLLGLFFGFSLLSIVEIIYYITLRPMCHYMRRNSSQKHDVDAKIA